MQRDNKRPKLAVMVRKAATCCLPNVVFLHILSFLKDPYKTHRNNHKEVWKTICVTWEWFKNIPLVTATAALPEKMKRVAPRWLVNRLGNKTHVWGKEEVRFSAEHIHVPDFAYRMLESRLLNGVLLHILLTSARVDRRGNV